MKRKMAKILLAILIVSTTAPQHALASYQAQEYFSEKDVLDLVESYYNLHDTRADAEDYFSLLSNDELKMVMGKTVTSKSEFESWLALSKFIGRSVKHTVKSINIAAKSDGSYFVTSCIRYKGRTRIFTSFDKSSKIDWVIVESDDLSRLTIKTYLVLEDC